MDQPGDVDYSQRVEDAISLISKAVDQCASSMQLDTSPNARRIVELDVPLPFIDSQTNSNNDCKCKPWDYSCFFAALKLSRRRTGLQNLRSWTFAVCTLRLDQLWTKSTGMSNMWSADIG